MEPLNAYEILEALRGLRSKAIVGEMEEALRVFSLEVFPEEAEEEADLPRRLRDILGEISDASRGDREECSDIIQNLVEVEVYTPEHNIQVYF